MKFLWPIITVVAVPLLMIITKTNRINGRERHEIQMRVKSYSQYRIKGAAFTKKLQTRVLDQLEQSKDVLCGREMQSILTDEWQGKHAKCKHNEQEQAIYQTNNNNTGFSANKLWDRYVSSHRLQLVFEGVH